MLITVHAVEATVVFYDLDELVPNAMHACTFQNLQTGGKELSYCNNSGMSYGHIIIDN